MLEKIIIYTDGACKGNPGIGGWGVLLKIGTTTKELFGGAAHTTNNRMELTAAIEALKALLSQPENTALELWTDSNYVKQGITLWIQNWKKKNWKTSTNKPVMNVELWQQLDTLCQKYQIEWKWVKGHSGDPGNEAADRLANKGIAQLQQKG